MKKRFLAGTLAVFLVVSLLAGQAVAADSNAVDNARRGVARVFCVYECRDGDLGTMLSARRFQNYYVGSAFGVGTAGSPTNTFVTNSHVVRPTIENEEITAKQLRLKEDGKLVSEAAVAELVDQFSRLDRDGDIAEQLVGGILHANDRLYSLFQGAGGTTAVVCLFFQETLYWASVGDSCIYLKRGEGLYRLNREQNYRAELYLEAVRLGQLDASGANSDPDGPRLSQFLGKDKIDEVDASLHPLELLSGDTLLLCSDGVGGVLSEEALSACLAEVSPALACAQIGERIRAANREHQDNYTALVVKCEY